MRSESDLLPGFVADRVGDALVVQFSTVGANKWASVLTTSLMRSTGVRNIYERSDLEMRVVEGLKQVRRIRMGNPALVQQVREYPGTVFADASNDHAMVCFQANIKRGHKTGFYFDQRANRRLVGMYAKGKDVLDCFSYTGGFAMHALAGGAKSVHSIDGSLHAVNQASANAELNGVAVLSRTVSSRTQRSRASALEKYRAKKAGRSADKSIGRYAKRQSNKRKSEEHSHSESEDDSSDSSDEVNADDFLSQPVSAVSIASGIHLEVDDVFVALRRFRDEGRSYDMIILDPPKFAHTAESVQNASQGYKDINRIALHLLRPGGLLFSFSCSSHITAPLFQQIVASAAADAKVDCQILHHLHADVDHPVSIHFPEGAYLKGLVLIKRP